MISASYFWTNVFLLAVGTFFIRFSFISLSSRVKIPSYWSKMFTYVPASILPAFIAPAVYYHQGSVSLLMGRERLIVILFMCVLSYFYRSTLLTIVLGLFCLWALTLLSL